MVNRDLIVKEIVSTLFSLEKDKVALKNWENFTFNITSPSFIINASGSGKKVSLIKIPYDNIASITENESHFIIEVVGFERKIQNLELDKSNRIKFHYCLWLGQMIEEVEKVFCLIEQCMTKDNLTPSHCEQLLNESKQGIKKEPTKH